MSLLKRQYRVSIEFPDDEYTLANEKLIAYFVNDEHDELRIREGHRAVAWYFDTVEHAETFTDMAATELARFAQFKVTQP